MGIRLAEVHHCVCVITPLSITLSLGLDLLTTYMVGRITDMRPPGMTEMVALTVAVPGGAVSGEGDK